MIWCIIQLWLGLWLWLGLCCQLIVVIIIIIFTPQSWYALCNKAKIMGIKVVKWPKSSIWYHIGWVDILGYCDLRQRFDPLSFDCHHLLMDWVLYVYTMRWLKLEHGRQKAVLRLCLSKLAMCPAGYDTLLWLKLVGATALVFDNNQSVRSSVSAVSRWLWYKNRTYLEVASMVVS